jgi:hypothetical protein
MGRDSMTTSSGGHHQCGDAANRGNAPPKRFSGGGYWEAMKGDMTGWFEVRVDGPMRHHYRLFLLDYDAQDHDKPLLVVIDGRDKPFSTTFSDADYAAGRRSARSTGRGTQGQSAGDQPLRPGFWTSATAWSPDNGPAPWCPRCALPEAAGLLSFVLPAEGARP